MKYGIVSDGFVLLDVKMLRRNKTYAIKLSGTFYYLFSKQDTQVE